MCLLTGRHYCRVLSGLPLQSCFGLISLGGLGCAISLSHARRSLTQPVTCSENQEVEAPFQRSHWATSPLSQESLPHAFPLRASSWPFLSGKEKRAEHRDSDSSAHTKDGIVGRLWLREHWIDSTFPAWALNVFSSSGYISALQWFSFSHLPHFHAIGGGVHCSIRGWDRMNVPAASWITPIIFGTNLSHSNAGKQRILSEPNTLNEEHGWNGESHKVRYFSFCSTAWMSRSWHRTQLQTVQIFFEAKIKAGWWGAGRWS